MFLRRMKRHFRGHYSMTTYLPFSTSNHVPRHQTRWNGGSDISIHTVDKFDAAVGRAGSGGGRRHGCRGRKGGNGGRDGVESEGSTLHCGCNGGGYRRRGNSGVDAVFFLESRSPPLRAVVYDVCQLIAVSAGDVQEL